MILSNTPTGTVALTEGGFGVYYQDSKGLWKRDNFDTNGVFKQTIVIRLLNY